MRYAGPAHGGRMAVAPVLAALTLFSLLALLAGCAARDGRITLRYDPQGSRGSASGQVAVASFLDAREDAGLGRAGDLDLRSRSRGVDEWVRASLMEELSRRGCRALPAAVEGETRPLVGGTVSAARLAATGMDHVLDLEFTLTLSRGNEVVFKKTYAGRWERTLFMAGPGDFEAMFASALEELLSTAASDIASRLGP